MPRTRGASFSNGAQGPDTLRKGDPEVSLVPDWHWQYLAEGRLSR